MTTGKSYYVVKKTDIYLLKSSKFLDRVNFHIFGNLEFIAKMVSMQKLIPVLTLWEKHSKMNFTKQNLHPYVLSEQLFKEIFSQWKLHVHVYFIYSMKCIVVWPWHYCLWFTFRWQ